MALSLTLLAQLEAHGVTSAHLEALLAVLQLQRNGSWAWNYANGHVTQCDLRIVVPGRAQEVRRVTEGVVRGITGPP